MRYHDLMMSSTVPPTQSGRVSMRKSIGVLAGVQAWKLAGTLAAGQKLIPVVFVASAPLSLYIKHWPIYRGKTHVNSPVFLPLTQEDGVQKRLGGLKRKEGRSRCARGLQHLNEAEIQLHRLNMGLNDIVSHTRRHTTPKREIRHYKCLKSLPSPVSFVQYGHVLFQSPQTLPVDFGVVFPYKSRRSPVQRYGMFLSA